MGCKRVIKEKRESCRIRYEAEPRNDLNLFIGYFRYLSRAV